MNNTWEDYQGDIFALARRSDRPYAAYNILKAAVENNPYDIYVWGSNHTTTAGFLRQLTKNFSSLPIKNLIEAVGFSNLNPRPMQKEPHIETPVKADIHFTTSTGIELKVLKG